MSTHSARAPGADRRVWLGVAAFVLCGCAVFAHVTGDFDEYSLYRRTRLADTLEERLGAGAEYLADYPRGQYHGQVRSWFLPAEEHYFQRAYDDLPRLRAYLASVPKGPHAKDAARRIVELETARSFVERRQARELSEAERVETSLASAERERSSFLREMVALLRLLGGVRSFGQPTSELDSELIYRFRLTPPQGVCRGDQCTKPITFRFSVPEGGQQRARQLDLLLEFALERGLLQSVSLSGVDLFVRLAEASDVRPVPVSDALARAEAIGSSLDLLQNALSPVLPAAACAADAVSPVVLSRSCQGVVLQAIAATEPGQPDRVVVRPQAAR